MNMGLSVAIFNNQRLSEVDPGESTFGVGRFLRWDKFCEVFYQSRYSDFALWLLRRKAQGGFFGGQSGQTPRPAGGDASVTPVVSSSTKPPIEKHPSVRAKRDEHQFCQKEEGTFMVFQCFPSIISCVHLLSCSSFTDRSGSPHVSPGRPPWRERGLMVLALYRSAEASQVRDQDCCVIIGSPYRKH